MPLSEETKCDCKPDLCKYCCNCGHEKADDLVE